jgi:uncharacterized membrane protein
MTAGPSSVDAERHGRPVTVQRAEPAVHGTLELTLALLALAVVGASVVLTAAQLLLPTEEQVAFLLKNDLAFRTRSWIIPLVLAGAVLPPAMALLMLAARGRAISDAIWRVAWASSPLALAWAVPSLFAYRIWYDKPTPYLIFLAVFVLAAEQLLQRFLLATGTGGFAADHRDQLAARTSLVARWLPLAIVICAAAAYAAFTAHYSLLQHWRFTTGAYDLGIYDNLIFNNMHGRFFRCPILKPGINYIAGHAEFASLLIVPIYAIKPGPELLLIVQSIFIGGAAIPLYKFAATQLTRSASALIAVAYLLYAPVHGPNFYDFHWMPMALPLWFTLFYAIARRNKWLIAVMVFLLLSVREEMGVMLAVLGLFLILTAYWQRLGMILVVLGVFAFAATRFVIMPLLGSWWFENMYADLIPPGDHGFTGVVRTLLTNPGFVWKTFATEAKLTFALHLFAPLAFLPLRRPAFCLLALPGTFFTLLTTNYPHTLSIRFQYTAHWVPWLFAATILMLKTTREGPRGPLPYRAALCTMVFAVVCHSYVYGALLQQNVFVGGFNSVKFAPLTAEEKKRLATFSRLTKHIPPDASVAATDNESAHVATRVNAYTLRVAHGKAKFLLIRGSSLHGESKKNALAAMNLTSYQLIDQGEDLYLFKKGPTTEETKRALRTLHLNPKPPPPKPPKPPKAPKPT